MNFQNFLPYENYSFTSRLSITEAKNRILNNIRPKNNSQIFDMFYIPDKPYEGSISNEEFAIRRIINYKNSFLPNITGSITNNEGITVIKIKMKLKQFVIIFVSIWFSSLSIVCIGSFINKSLYNNKQFLLMIIFGYMLVVLGFKSESSKAKKFLANILEAN